MVYNYETLKQLAQRDGKKVTDLIAMSRNRDPFYVGAPGDVIKAKWFADIWHRFNYVSGIHIRRMLYQIVSQEKSQSILLPSGKAFENTESHWKFLVDASEKARYLNFVDFSAFDDRRNPVARINSAPTPEPSVSVDESESWVMESMPPFPDLPTYTLDNYAGTQGYIIELWVEKSTMNDIVVPITKLYDCNLQTGVGELSITKTFELFERVRQAGRPTRIGYLSDFDPGGQSMPVAVARKLEFFMRTRGGSLRDVRLFPICLSLDQVVEYQLPRTPIKDTEERKEGFEHRFGVGATELDALEAVHPGSLDQIIRRWLNRYYDHSLEQRVADARGDFEQELEDIREAVIANHQKEIDSLRDQWEAIREDCDKKIKAHGKKMARLVDKLTDELGMNASGLGSHSIPQAAQADETVEALYDSNRDYFQQLAVYKKFQGRNDDEDDE
jgi:hypothetical protein